MFYSVVAAQAPNTLEWKNAVFSYKQVVTQLHSGCLARAPRFRGPDFFRKGLPVPHARLPACSWSVLRAAKRTARSPHRTCHRHHTHTPHAPPSLIRFLKLSRWRCCYSASLPCLGGAAPNQFQLGLGAASTRLTPTHNPFLSGVGGGVVSVSAGANHSVCAVASGWVMSWGHAEYNQQGVAGEEAFLFFRRLY